MKYIVEHMEEGVYQWVKNEYTHMAQTVGSENLIFTNLKEDEKNNLPQIIDRNNCFLKSVVDLGIPLDKICLLDQEATQLLSPEDENNFEYMLFGGILGDEDTEAIDCIVRDRTSELRKFNFPTRHLSSVQMTTDGAVLVSKLILDDKIPFDSIKFIDNPEIRLGKNETTVMPFRYVTDDEGKPRMAPGMIELLKEENFEF